MTANSASGSPGEKSLDSILHVITTINRGGAENHLVALVRGQRQQGTRVAVAYLKGDGYWTSHLQALGVEVFALELQWYGEISPLLKLRRCIATWRPDLIHAHMPPAELYARLALLGRPGIPFAVSKHNDEPFYRGPGERMVGRWCARRAARMIAISDAVRRYVSGSALGVDAGKVVTVRYGIDATPYLGGGAERIQALRDSWGIRPEEWVIGTVARLAPQKALHVLLRGFAAYRHDAGQPARLVIVGVGPLDAELRELARTLNIEQAVVWAGFRDDIPDIMASFDLFALSSAYEGFGLVLLEAMAAGRPVLATTVSAIPEIVVDRQTGILVPPHRPDAIAEGLRFMESRNDREKFGLAGRARAIGEFSIEAMLERTAAVYDDARAEHPP